MKRLIPLVLATMAFCLFASAIQASADYYSYTLTIDKKVIKVSQSKSFILQVGVKKFVNQKESTVLKVSKLELRFNHLPNDVLEIMKGKDYIDIHVLPADMKVPNSSHCQKTYVARRLVRGMATEDGYQYSCYLKCKGHVYMFFTDVPKKQKGLPKLFEAAVKTFKEVK